MFHYTVTLGAGRICLEHLRLLCDRLFRLSRTVVQAKLINKLSRSLKISSAKLGIEYGLLLKLMLCLNSSLLSSITTEHAPNSRTKRRGRPCRDTGIAAPGVMVLQGDTLYTSRGISAAARSACKTFLASGTLPFLAEPVPPKYRCRPSRGPPNYHIFVEERQNDSDLK